MNQSGIVRKIDDLGRIVLPKELRKFLNINPGDDFHILLDNNKIVLEKYSYLNNNEDKIIEMLNIFSEITEYDINLIVSSKIINKDNAILNAKYNNLIKERKQIIEVNNIINEVSNNYTVEGKSVLTPIVLNSDLLGTLFIISKDNIDNIINYSNIISKLIKNYYK